MKMNKNDFVNKMQELYLKKFEDEKNKTKNWGVRKLDFEAYVDAVFETVKTVMSNGDSVAIPGFGTFEVTEKPERKGRNPQTGEELLIPAHKIPKFKPGKGLKDVVQ